MWPFARSRKYGVAIGTTGAAIVVVRKGQLLGVGRSLLKGDDNFAGALAAAAAQCDAANNPVVLAVAARESDLMERIADCEAAGMRVVHTVQSPLACLAASRHANTPAHDAIIEIGAAASTLVVPHVETLAEGAVQILSHVANIARCSVAEAQQYILEPKTEGEIYGAIYRSADRGKAAERAARAGVVSLAADIAKNPALPGGTILITGDGALLPNMRGALEDATGSAVIVWSPIGGFAGCRFTAAFGAAVHDRP